jgi:hypothetical protein
VNRSPPARSASPHFTRCPACTASPPTGPLFERARWCRVCGHERDGTPSYTTLEIAERFRAEDAHKRLGTRCTHLRPVRDQIHDSYVVVTDREPFMRTCHGYLDFNADGRLACIYCHRLAIEE